MSTHPLDCLESSDRPLLALVCDRIDDAMLLEIARADYGDDVELHLEILHQIRAGSIPAPLQWHPGEVLCLTRWTEWDSLTARDEAIATRNRWMRLFACTVLIWASLEPENYEYQAGSWDYSEGEDSTIIQFLDSALSLGDDVSISQSERYANAALQFLGWRMQSQIQRALVDEDFGNCPCYAVAMLLLCVSLNRCDTELVNFLITMAYCNSEYIPIFKEINEGQLSQKWRDKISQILLDPAAPEWVRSNPALQSLGIEIMGNAADRLDK
jgi:hypothetical protein